MLVGVTFFLTAIIFPIMSKKGATFQDFYDKDLRLYLGNFLLIKGGTRVLSTFCLCHRTQPHLSLHFFAFAFHIVIRMPNASILTFFLLKVLESEKSMVIHSHEFMNFISRFLDKNLFVARFLSNVTRTFFYLYPRNHFD